MSVAVSRPRENRSDKGSKVNGKMLMKSGKLGTQQGQPEAELM